jgi:DNA-binding NarL/FixJ family response regulator
MIRVLLVDDQTLIRQGIAMLLELEPDLEVVAQSATDAPRLRRSSACVPMWC